MNSSEENEWNDNTLPIYSETYGISSSIARTILRKRNLENNNPNISSISSHSTSSSTLSTHPQPTLPSTTELPPRKNHSLSTLSGIISKLMDHRPDLNPFSSIYVPSSSRSSISSLFTIAPMSPKKNSSSKYIEPITMKNSNSCIRTLSTTDSPLLGPITVSDTSSSLSHPIFTLSNSFLSNNNNTFSNSNHDKVVHDHHYHHYEYEQLREYARTCAYKVEQMEEENKNLSYDIKNLHEMYQTKFIILQNSLHQWKNELINKENELNQKEKHLQSIMDLLEASRILLQKQAIQYQKYDSDDYEYFDQVTQTEPEIQLQEVGEESSSYFNIHRLLFCNTTDYNADYIQQLRIMIARLYNRNYYLYNKLLMYKLLLQDQVQQHYNLSNNNNNINISIVTNKSMETNNLVLHHQDEFLNNQYTQNIQHRIRRSYNQQLLRNTLEQTIMTRKFRESIDKQYTRNIDDESSIHTDSSNDYNDTSIYNNPSSKSTAGGASILSFRLEKDFDFENEFHSEGKENQNNNIEETKDVVDHPTLSIGHSPRNKIPPSQINPDPMPSVPSTTFSYLSLSSLSSPFSAPSSMNIPVPDQTLQRIHHTNHLQLAKDNYKDSSTQTESISLSSSLLFGNSSIVSKNRYVSTTISTVTNNFLSTQSSTESTLGSSFQYSSRAAYHGLKLAQLIEQESGCED